MERHTPDEQPRGELNPIAPELPGFHPPRQERSRQTFNRITAAALELVVERGAEGVTIKEIVGRAESSVGSFYARFDGKEELLRYLAERVWREVDEAWSVAVEIASRSEAGLEEGGRELVRGLVQVHRIHPEARAALSGTLDEPGSRAARAFERRVEEDGTALLLAHRSRIEHPDPEVAVAFLIRILSVAVPAALARPALPRDPEEEFTRLAVRYLTGGRTRHRGSDEVEFFDVWG